VCRFCSCESLQHQQTKESGTNPGILRPTYFNRELFPHPNPTSSNTRSWCLTPIHLSFALMDGQGPSHIKAPNADNVASESESLPGQEPRRARS